MRLTEIFRQAGQSWIVRAAHAHQPAASCPSRRRPANGDFYFVEADDARGDPRHASSRWSRERIPARFGLDPFRDVQVLTPMNRSELGARNLNQQLAGGAQPAAAGEPEVERFGWTFRVGDKVMQTREQLREGSLQRRHRPHRGHRPGRAGADGRFRRPARSSTISASWTSWRWPTPDDPQGAGVASIPAVVIPLHTQHYMMLQRNLLYTGITRGKKLVVLVGSRKALAHGGAAAGHGPALSALAGRLRKEEHENSVLAPTHDDSAR